MKNNFLYKFLIIFFIFILNIKAEQFNFDVTEIEILKMVIYTKIEPWYIETDNGL